MSVTFLVLTAIAASAQESGGAAGQRPGAVVSHQLELVRSFAVPFGVSDHKLVDLDGSNAGVAHELVVLGSRGEVLVFGQQQAENGAFSFGPDSREPLKLPDFARSLVDLAQFVGRGGQDLVVLGPRDARVYARKGLSFGPESVVLSRRAGHGLRVGAPRFVDIAQDVNGDGAEDLVVPAADVLRLFLSSVAAKDSAESSPWPQYAAAATLAVEISKSTETVGKHLSDELSSSFSIPSIVARDVNGDGRADLLVTDGSTRAFHLQSQDGTFPVLASISVDLSIFRDSVEKAELRPGRTLSMGEQATYEMRDLDRDGIPDFVIGHRRKVWVFHGTSEGPQFTKPSMIFKTADDITTMQLMRLDADDLPDLLLVKVQIPTIAALVRGIFGDWDVEITAAGYLSKDGRTFETRPSKRAELAVRLPAILRLIKDPSSFLKRFDEIGARFRRSVWGDFDGNGARDVVLAGADGRQLEIWLSEDAEADGSRSLDGEALLTQLLFEDEQRVWDLDRIAGWLGGLAERRTALLTGGKPSAAQFPIRPMEQARLITIEAADLDGDGREELVLRYELTAGNACVFDVLRMLSK